MSTYYNSYIDRYGTRNKDLTELGQDFYYLLIINANMFHFLKSYKCCYVYIFYDISE